MPTKTRTARIAPVTGFSRVLPSQPWTPYSVAGLASSETSVSLYHARLNGRWASGGPWTMSRSWHSASIQRSSTNLFDGQYRLSLPNQSIPDLTPYVAPTFAQMDADGAHAISATEPTQPAFDFSVFFGEFMQDGIPRLPGLEMKEATAKAKSAGGEFLNVEFGWLPLVSDARSFANAVNNSDTILRNYQEHANMVVKRSFHWPSKSNTLYTPCGFSSAPAGHSYSGGGRFQTILQDRWFEADYVYHLPTGTSVNDKLRRYGSYARKLLGVRMTPEVLWNLAPWSWAVDWFSNVGDVIHNVSAMGTDGLVMRNGYVMCHTQRVTHDHGRSAGGDGFHVLVEETKLRDCANPYGFGTSGLATTLRQKAIIGALGLSRHYS